MTPQELSLLVKVPVSTLESVTGLQDGELLFYDTSTPENKLKKIDISTFNNLSKTAKPLAPTDPTPTIEGLYVPTVSGTYANAGGLVAQEGYYTLFFFDGANWTKSESKLPEVSQDDYDFIKFSEYWQGNNFLDITENTSISIDKTIKQGFLLLKQDSTGGKTLTVEGLALDINLEPDSKTLIGYILVAGVNLVFSINKNLVETAVDIPDNEAPTSPLLKYLYVENNSVKLELSGSTDNVFVKSYDIYKDGVFVKNTEEVRTVITGLTVDTSYFFKAKAKDLKGNISEFSNQISVKTTNKITEFPTFTNHTSGFTEVSPGIYEHDGSIEGVAVSDQILTGNGYVEFSANYTGQPIIALDDNATLNQYQDPPGYLSMVFLNSSKSLFEKSRSGVTTLLLSDITGILKFRISRYGNQFKIMQSIDGFIFTEISTLSDTSSASLYIKFQNLGGESTINDVTLTNDLSV